MTFRPSEPGVRIVGRYRTPVRETLRSEWWDAAVPEGWHACPRCDMLTRGDGLCGYCVAEVGVHPAARMGEVALSPPDDSPREAVPQDGTLPQGILVRGHRQRIVGAPWEPSLGWTGRGSALDRYGGEEMPSSISRPSRRQWREWPRYLATGGSGT